MATLYIKEYQLMKKDDQGFLIGPGPLITQQKVTIAGTSAQSSALNGKTKFVILESDIPCQYAVGTNPTADTNSQFLSANNRLLEPVVGNETLKIAVITQQ